MLPSFVARLSRGSLLLLSAGFAVGAAASEAPLLTSADGGAFRAAGKLQAASHCTASVVAGSAEPDASRPALVLTAAHCVIPEAFTEKSPGILHDVPAAAGWAFTPAYFHDTASSHREIPVDRVLYATLKGSDLAVLQLKATYGDLRAAGVLPWVLAGPDIRQSLPVELAHIPVDGVPSPGQYLRLSRCEASEPLRLFESARFFSSASRVDCAGVAGGSSGGPVLRAGLPQVVGVMSTATDPRFEGCGYNRPCELPGRMPLPREGASYITPVAPLMSALRADGSWDPNALDKGDGVALGRTTPQYTRSVIDVEIEVEVEGAAPGSDDKRIEIVQEPARWGVVVTSGERWIRYKQGDAAVIDCADEAGYSEPLLAREQPLDRLALPAGDGAYLMCVIGEKGIDNDWQRPEHASTMLRIIDDTAPTKLPSVHIVEQDPQKWTLELRGYDPATVFDVARRPFGNGDCVSTQGYRSIPSSFLVMSKAKAPLRLCVKARDEAGNLSPPGFIDLEAPPAD